MIAAKQECKCKGLQVMLCYAIKLPHKTFSLFHPTPLPLIITKSHFLLAQFRI